MSGGVRNTGSGRSPNSQRIHVLHVVPTLRAGGMELALARVINGLIPQGITHSIVVLKGDALIRDHIDPLVRIQCVNAGARDPTVPARLRRLILQESPTVIHARNLAAWPEVALARLAVWPLVPLVFSFHGVAEARDVPWRWRLMSRVLARLTTRIFTVSEGSKRFLVDHIGLSAARISVVPNGVDTARFHPSEHSAVNSELVIGTVGSLAAVKNQALLIRACHKLMKRGVRLRLDIAGEGPERPALEKLIESLSMTGNIRLPGHLSDTPAFLNSLDIFVLPSDSEAHPNALSEAAACGLPCIASRVGGVPEIVDQGRVALLFDRGDEDALVDLLWQLATDQDRRRTLGESGRDFTVRNYSMATMLERYGNLYQGLSGSIAETRIHSGKT